MKTIIYILIMCVLCFGCLTTCFGADTYGVSVNSSITTSEGTEHFSAKSVVRFYTPEELEEMRQYRLRVQEAHRSHQEYLKKYGHGHSTDPIINPYITDEDIRAEYKRRQEDKRVTDNKVMQFRLEQATNGSTTYQLKVSTNYLHGTDGFPTNKVLADYWYQKAQVKK